MKKTLLLSYVLIISGCDFAAIEMPLPSETPKPSPSSSPEPVPEIVPEVIPVLLAPRYAPTHSPVTISLCLPYVAGTQLVVDNSVPLGTFGENRASGCMQIVYPGFNTAGVRMLSVGSLKHEIIIVNGK